MRTASPLAALLAAALAAGACTLALEPTVPAGGPPRVADGLRLLRVPVEVVAALSQPEVRIHRDAVLARDRSSLPGRDDAILRHYVITGMSPGEVVWSFESHPTRVRDHGPPGGHTYYWEPGRYWVRFDEMGKAVSAGRY